MGYSPKIFEFCLENKKENLKRKEKISVLFLFHSIFLIIPLYPIQIYQVILQSINRK